MFPCMVKVCITLTITIIVPSLLLEHSLIEVHGWLPFIVRPNELSSQSFSPKCRINSSVTYPDVMNMHLEILESVKTAYASVQLFLQSADGKYDLAVINRTIDLCRIFKDISYESILQVGLRLSKTNTNDFDGCFIKKGIYTMEHFRFDVEKLPPILPEKNVYFSQTYLLDKT